MTPTCPTITLNGSSPDSLIEPLGEFYAALSSALEACANTTPNARDYQAAPERWATAREEHLARVKALDAMRAEVLAIIEDIDEQKARRA